MVRYKEIGNEKLEEFFVKFEKKFDEFFKVREQKIKEFWMKRRTGRMALEEDLERDTHTVKFKPKKQLRDYQTQERLVALEERIEEATNFRKELKDLEVDEANRLSKLWMEFKIA